MKNENVVFLDFSKILKDVLNFLTELLLSHLYLLIILLPDVLHEIYPDHTQWRNVEGLAKKSPLGGKKSPLRGAPRSRVYLEQFVKKWPKNLNK